MTNNFKFLTVLVLVFEGVMALLFCYGLNGYKALQASGNTIQADQFFHYAVLVAVVLFFSQVFVIKKYWKACIGCFRNGSKIYEASDDISG